MEAIKSIYFEIQERFRNPVISTFIISWLCWNWKITLLTIHFLTDSNSSVTIDEYFLKVQTYATAWQSIIHPVLTVFFYILIFPFIRNGVSYIQTRFERSKTELELSASKGSSVSIEKYMVLRNDYMLKLKELENVIAGESVQIKKNDELNTKINQLNYDLSLKIDENATLNKQLSSSLINGTWSFKIKSNNSLHETLDKIKRISFINNTFTCYYLDEPKTIIKGDVILFHSNFKEHSVFMLLKIIDVNDNSNIPFIIKDLFFQLKESEDFNCLVGILNFENNVEMIRRQPGTN
jgi:hypothetical protein